MGDCFHLGFRWEHAILCTCMSLGSSRRCLIVYHLTRREWSHCDRQICCRYVVILWVEWMVLVTCDCLHQRRYSICRLHVQYVHMCAVNKVYVFVIWSFVSSLVRLTQTLQSLSRVVWLWIERLRFWISLIYLSEWLCSKSRRFNTRYIVSRRIIDKLLALVVVVIAKSLA